MSGLTIVEALVYNVDSNEARVVDIRIRNGIIEHVGSVAGDAATMINALGDVVSPGFVDIHINE
jgi:dihydroorotase-like cyclic amidohydrolase